MAFARALDFLYGMGKVCGGLEALFGSHATRTLRQSQTLLAVD
jgi:hypothetical protein